MTFRAHPVGWSLAAAQGVFAVWFAACVALSLSRSGQMPFEAAILIFWTMSAGMLLAPVGMIASGLMLAVGYARRNRALFVALLGGGLAMLATVVVSVSPLGQLLMGTLLD